MPVDVEHYVHTIRSVWRESFKLLLRWHCGYNRSLKAPRFILQNIKSTFYQSAEIERRQSLAPMTCTVNEIRKLLCKQRFRDDQPHQLYQMCAFYLHVCRKTRAFKLSHALCGLNLWHLLGKHPRNKPLTMPKQLFAMIEHRSPFKNDLMRDNEDTSCYYT